MIGSLCNLTVIGHDPPHVFSRSNSALLGAQAQELSVWMLPIPNLHKRTEGIENHRLHHLAPPHR
jgi:hypothetical protein